MCVCVSVCECECVCGCVIVGLCVIVGACGRKNGTTFTADRIKKVMTSSEFVLSSAQIIVQKGYEGGITQKVI